MGLFNKKIIIIIFGLGKKTKPKKEKGKNFFRFGKKNRKRKGKK
jgi:hypothetical protein